MRKSPVGKCKGYTESGFRHAWISNALEVTKAMKTARAELKKVQIDQTAWDAPEPEPEKMYLRIPANVQCAEKRETQKSTGQKRSIHERLEEKKQIVEQQPKKKKQRNGMEL